ncbi:MAG: hypothetical protein ACLRI7_10280 [Ruthenibacterium lactatiformans]
MRHGGRTGGLAAPVRIDAYAGTTQEQALLFDTGELPYGNTR